MTQDTCEYWQAVNTFQQTFSRHTVVTTRYWWSWGTAIGSDRSGVHIPLFNKCTIFRFTDGCGNMEYHVSRRIIGKFCSVHGNLVSHCKAMFLDTWFLTHWGRVTHICVSKLTIIASDNGLSPGRRQAIIWTSAGILSIGPLGTNFSEILIAIITFSFKKMRLKLSSAKWRPCCLGLNVLRVSYGYRLL